jgi:hypothetical protein
MRSAIPVLLCFAIVTAACGEESTPGRDSGAGDAGTAATVVGTLALPAATSGKPYSVRILRVPGAVPVGEATGTTAGGTTLSYTIPAVPAGSYFLLGFVDVDGSGGQSSTPGDQAGWYGHTGDGNPPSVPNAVVPASGTVRFDFSLVVR